MFVGLAVSCDMTGLVASMLHRSPYIVWTRLFLKTYINHPIMQHIHAYKLVATSKMILM
jgi:hypothetical protein